MLIRIKKIGFTLIEVVIALAILGMGLTAVMGYLPVAFRASKKADDLSKATLIARSLFEEIKDAAKDNITNIVSSEYQNYADYPGFEYKVDADLLGQICTVTITVRWKFYGEQNEEKFETKIVKYNAG